MFKKKKKKNTDPVYQASSTVIDKGRDSYRSWGIVMILVFVMTSVSTFFFLPPRLATGINIFAIAIGSFIIISWMVKRSRERREGRDINW